MPDPYTPAGSSRVFSVPAALDPTDVATWFEDALDDVDGYLTEVQNDSGLDPFFLMGA